MKPDLEAMLDVTLTDQEIYERTVREEGTRPPAGMSPERWLGELVNACEVRPRGVGPAHPDTVRSIARILREHHAKRGGS